MAEEFNISTVDPELLVLQRNKDDGYDYRRRRHEDWDDIYTYYRGKPIINRLIQRQSVHVPLMKQNIKSLLKDVDDMPVLYFENLDNDKQAELFKNAYWEKTVEHNRLELQDIMDKKQVFLFGRTYDQMQVINGKVSMIVQDPMDILVQRYADPFNIHSSRFLSHLHIFRPLSVIQQNETYDKEAVARLTKWFQTNAGLIKAADNTQEASDKVRKMQAIGDTTASDPILGETYVELTMHFVYHKEGSLDEQLWLYVEAENQAILMKKPLEKIIGETADHYWRDHFPYNSWADDIERQDWFSDSVGDILLPLCKIVDAWASQLVENRTLRNLNMFFYDQSEENFNPNTYQPRGFGFYGLPGKPSDIIQPVNIADLTESIDEIKFFIEIGEKASGATATQQGAQTSRQVTLGEVQLALGEAKERIKGMSKFYIPAWQQRGETFIKLIEAAGDKLDAVRIFKKGRITDNLFSREVGPEDWQSKLGYRCKVWSKNQKDAQDSEGLQKWNAVKTNMPDNPKVDEIWKRKMIEFADPTPEEMLEILDYERQKREALQMAAMGNPMLGGQIGQPALPQPAQPIQPALPAPKTNGVVK